MDEGRRSVLRGIALAPVVALVASTEPELTAKEIAFLKRATPDQPTTWAETELDENLLHSMRDRGFLHMTPEAIEYYRLTGQTIYQRSPKGEEAMRRIGIRT